MNAERDILAAEGVAPNGDTWALRYRPHGMGGRHEMALYVNGDIREDASGWDIPDTTEIGFGGGFKRGEGNRYIYGLVTSRINVVRAETNDEGDQTEVSPAHLPVATTGNGVRLRCFVLVRPPVDDVTALVGLDGHGQVVQRIPFIGPTRGR
ncbi:hypothetical protein [Nocardioides lacusdianchii]|uniref:hypothetical protein n=1 Tax=Nocardioides lacusdianchii TaxID=2783664 RepID=UPI001CCF732D|nr:hypothetical protein [Nocardioides lacusdianchii]